MTWIDPKAREAHRYTNQSGLSRKVVLTLGTLALDKANMIFQNIFGSVKASLQRLGLEYIDVLQCHRFDANTPIEETVRILFPLGDSSLLAHVHYSRCKPCMMLSKLDM
jgi:aryl-alcohol dehydrogenase-like predicted oxidoreductase